jgi:predicted HTH domain antitoxin
MNGELTKTIASELQIFQTVEQKENFIFLVGALLAKVISIQKAAEVMEIETEMFLQILDLMGIEFSYLSENDVAIEKNWELV